MLLRIRKADTQQNPVQKSGRAVGNATRLEVIAGQKMKLVSAFLKGLTLKQRIIAAPVVICDKRLYKFPFTRSATFSIKLNGDARTRHTFGGIQDMSSQTAHSHFTRT